MKDEKREKKEFIEVVATGSTLFFVIKTVLGSFLSFISYQFFEKYYPKNWWPRNRNET